MNNMSLEKILLRLFFLSLFCYQVVGMFQLSKIDSMNTSFYSIIPLSLFSLLLLLLNIRRIIGKKIFLINIFLLFSVIRMCIDPLTDTGNMNSIIVSFAQTFLVPVIFLLFYSIFSMRNLNNFFVTYSIFLLLGLSLCYYYIFLFRNVTLTASIEEFNSLNSAYFPMFVLPCVLIYKIEKWKKIITVIITVVVVLSCMKRGGFIALSLGLFFYFVVDYFFLRKRQNRFVSLFVFFIILCGLFLIFSQFEKMTGGVMGTRLTTVVDDEGSGRIFVYLNTISLIENSDIMHFLFGHGKLAVQRDSFTGLSAHNDFLEILYDYGFFMFVVFIAFHVSLIVNMFKLIYRKSVYSAALVMCYMMYIVISMVGHVLIYPYFLLLVMFLGTVFGNIKRERDECGK